MQKGKIKPGQSLAENAPWLMGEWDYDRNGRKTPWDYSCWSTETVMWLCPEQNHSFPGKIRNRYSSRGGCPVCSNRMLQKGYNDLATKSPELAKQIDPTINKGLTASDILYVTHDKVNWRCTDHPEHVWAAVVAVRYNRGDKCPYCTNKKLQKGYNDLATKAPGIAKQLDPNLNNGVTSSDILYGSNKKVTWRCDKHSDHIWEAVVATRHRRGDGCPYCLNKKLLKGFNDLHTRVPHIAKQFHPTLNGDKTTHDYLYGSNKSVWWQCDKNPNHTWKTSINTRYHQDTGCPKCKNTGTSFPEQVILYYMRKLFPDAIGRALVNGVEVDIYIPSKNVAIEYDGAIWHKDRANEDTHKNWLLEDKIFIRIREQGLEELNSYGCVNIMTNVYTNHETRELEESIYTLISHLRNNGVPIKPIDISIRRDRVEIRDQITQIRVENSLGERFPSIANCWDYKNNGTLTPFMVTFSSTEVINWVCHKCNNRWTNSVNQMTRIYSNGRCKYCLPNVEVVTKLKHSGKLLGVRFDIEGILFDITVEKLQSKQVTLNLENEKEEDLIQCEDGLLRTQTELQGMHVFDGDREPRPVNDVRRSKWNLSNKKC